MRRKEDVKYRIFAVAALLLYAAVTCCCLVFRGRQFPASEVRHINLRMLRWMADGNVRTMLKAMGTFMAFIPFGILFPTVFPSLRLLSRTASGCLVLAFAVEYMRYMTGRWADVDRVFLGLAGGIVGYIAFIYADNRCLEQNWWLAAAKYI